MSVPDAVLAEIVAAIPGGVLAPTDTDQQFTAGQIPVFDGIIPKTPPDRYVIVYIDNGTRHALAACGQSDSAYVRWQTTAVAPDGGQVRWLGDKVLGSVDVTPTATGWVCGQIQHVYGQRPQRDETVAERPVVYLIDQFEVLATRA